MNYPLKFGLKMRCAIFVLTLLALSTSQVSGQEKKETQLDKSRKDDPTPADEGFEICNLIPALKCELIWIALIALMMVCTIGITFSSACIAAAMYGNCCGFGVEAGEVGVGRVKQGVAEMRYVIDPLENETLREIPSRSVRLVF